MRCSFSVGSFTGPGYSAAIYLYRIPSLTTVGATITGMVFIFQGMIVHCCNESVLTPNAATFVILVRSGGAEYVGANRDA